MSSLSSNRLHHNPPGADLGGKRGRGSRALGPLKGVSCRDHNMLILRSMLETNTYVSSDENKDRLGYRCHGANQSWPGIDIPDAIMMMILLLLLLLLLLRLLIMNMITITKTIPNTLTILMTTITITTIPTTTLTTITTTIMVLTINITINLQMHIQTYIHIHIHIYKYK